MVHTIADAVRAVCTPLIDDPVCINVRRSHLLQDALKECKKAKFDPEKPLLVSTCCIATVFFNPSMIR